MWLHVLSFSTCTFASSWALRNTVFKKSKAKGLETIRSNRACSCWDTRSWVPNRNDLFLVSSTTKTLLIGAPSQGQRNSPHSLRIHIYTHKHNHTTTPSSATCSLGAEHSSSPSLSSLSLHLCLSQSLWGVGLSAERGDCSIAEKMYKMLSPLFCWALSIYSRSLEQYRKPLCSALKMSTWIWSSCIANNYKCGLELRHAQTHTHTHTHAHTEGGQTHYLPCWISVGDLLFMTECIWLYCVWCGQTCRVFHHTAPSHFGCLPYNRHLLGNECYLKARTFIKFTSLQLMSMMFQDKLGKAPKDC